MAQTHEPLQQPAHQCSWCPYTDALLKKVLNHMESGHHRCWCDLALYPPIAGVRPSERASERR
jgi:hypothetical protein